MPKRIQRQRAAGWQMPAGAVYVGRPAKWGNPYLLGPVGTSFPSLSDRQVAQYVVNCFKELAECGRGVVARGARLSSPEHEEVTYPSIEEIRAELAGRDLACWCALDKPCHADVLLKVAAGGGAW